jgi:hypothetical protein
MNPKNAHTAAAPAFVTWSIHTPAEYLLGGMLGR